jgi:hypothetical protein
MKKINLSRITIKTLEGQEQKVDIKNEFCNHLYFRGKTLQEVELARRLYHSSNDEDVTEEESKIITDTVKHMGYGYVLYKAISETLGMKAE